MTDADVADLLDIAFDELRTTRRERKQVALRLQQIADDLVTIAKVLEPNRVLPWDSPSEGRNRVRYLPGHPLPLDPIHPDSDAPALVERIALTVTARHADCAVLMAP